MLTLKFTIVMVMRISVEVEKYASAIRWLKELICNGIFDLEVRLVDVVI